MQILTSSLTPILHTVDLRGIVVDASLHGVAFESFYGIQLNLVFVDMDFTRQNKRIDLKDIQGVSEDLFYAIQTFIDARLHGLYVNAGASSYEAKKTVEAVKKGLELIVFKELKVFRYSDAVVCVTPEDAAPNWMVIDEKR